MASTILFSCLAAAALSYNTAVNLTHKLNATIIAGAALPDIQQEIKNDLFEGKNSGRGELADGIAYSWKAERRRSSPTILRKDDGFSGGEVYGRFQVELVDVALTITGNPDNRTHQFPFEYKELVWKERKPG